MVKIIAGVYSLLSVAPRFSVFTSYFPVHVLMTVVAPPLPGSNWSISAPALTAVVEMLSGNMGHYTTNPQYVGHFSKIQDVIKIVFPHVGHRLSYYF